MYNKELKQEYINTKVDPSEGFYLIINRIFALCEKNEESKGIDISEFTTMEILDLYLSICSTSIDSIKLYNHYYKDYTNFCLSKGLVKDNQNHFEEITLDMMSNCLNYAVIESAILTREELMHIIHQLDNVSDKALLLAIFEGICGPNMCELTELNINSIKDNTVILNTTRRELTISEELKNLFLSSINTDEYYTHNGIKITFINNNDVFKMRNNANTDTINRKALYNKLIKIKDLTGMMSINTKMLMESGRIEYINNQLEKTDKTVYQLLEETVYRYGSLHHHYAHYVEKYKKFIREN